MLQSLVMSLALAGTGQVPEAYIEVPQPPKVIRQAPKVTVEEQPPLVIPQPARVRVEQQPAQVVEQPPVRVPVYRLPAPEVRVYESVVVGQPVLVGSPLILGDPLLVQPGRGRAKVVERYEYKVRGRGLFGR